VFTGEEIKGIFDVLGISFFILFLLGLYIGYRFSRGRVYISLATGVAFGESASRIGPKAFPFFVSEYSTLKGTSGKIVFFNSPLFSSSLSLIERVLGVILLIDLRKALKRTGFFSLNKSLRINSENFFPTKSTVVSIEHESGWHSLHHSQTFSVSSVFIENHTFFFETWAI